MAQRKRGLGNHIKRLRKAAGITQQQLADATGIPRVTIARIEVKGTATARHVFRISRAFNLIPEEVFYLLDDVEQS